MSGGTPRRGELYLGRGSSIPAQAWHHRLAELIETMDLAHRAAKAPPGERQRQLVEELGTLSVFKRQLPRPSAPSAAAGREARGAELLRLIREMLAELAGVGQGATGDDGRATAPGQAPEAVWGRLDANRLHNPVDRPAVCWYLYVCEGWSPDAIARHWSHSSGPGAAISKRTVETWMWFRGLQRPRDFPVGKEEGLRTIHDAWVRRVKAVREGGRLPPSIGGRRRQEPLLGRAAELHSLERLAEGVRQGGRQLVLVEGPEGIGKTRLCNELAAHAERDGWRVVLGGCDEFLKSAFKPFVEVLRQYVKHRGEGLREELGPLGGELTRLVPELNDLVPGLRPRVGAGRRADSAGDRDLLFQAVRDLMAAASETTPLLVILEDLHWAEESTLHLLRYLARMRDPGRLLIVATYRRSREMEIEFADLGIQDAVVPISLTGLTERDVEWWARTQLGDRISADWSAVGPALCRKTDGNPRYIREWLLHLESAAGNGQDHLTDRDVDDSGVPPTLRALIARRVSRLSEPGRDLLSTASVIGYAFTLDVLARTADVTAGDALKALEEAERVGLIQQVEEREDCYRFEHVVSRDAVYSRVPRRRPVHRAIVSAIEALPEPASGWLAELAYHSAEALPEGDADAAAEYSIRAATWTAEQGAYEDAAKICARAMTALDRVCGEPHHVSRCRLLQIAGEAHRRAGHADEARSSFRDAARMSRAANDADLLAQTALAAFERVAGNPDAETIELLEEARRALGERQDALRARLDVSLAAALFDVPGQEARCQSLCSEARELAGSAGDPAALAHVLQGSFVARLLAPSDDLGDRLELINQAVMQAEAAGDPALALDTRKWKVYGLIEDGDMEGHDREVEIIAREADRLREPWHEQFVLAHRALTSIARGGFQEGHRLADRASEIGHRFGSGNAALIWAVQIATIWREKGKREDQEALAGLLESMADRHPALPWRAPLALVYAELGWDDKAREEFEALAIDQFRGLRRDLNWLGVVCLLAETCARLHDPQSAKVLYELLRPYADRAAPGGEGTTCWGSVEYYLGVLADAMDRDDDAIGHLRRAMKRNSEMGLRPYQARSQYALGRVRVKTGAAHGRELLESALQMADEVEMEGLAAEIRAALSRN